MNNYGRGQFEKLGNRIRSLREERARQTDEDEMVHLYDRCSGDVLMKYHLLHCRRGLGLCLFYK